MRLTFLLLACLISGISMYGQAAFVAQPTTPEYIPLNGTPLPSTCKVGQMFVLTSNAPGTNLYFCTSGNTWTQQVTGSGGSGGVTLPASVRVLGTNSSGTPLATTLLASDISNFNSAVTAAAPVTSVNGLTGAVTISAGAALPASVRVLGTNASGVAQATTLAASDISNFAATVVADAPVTSVNGLTGAVVISGGSGGGAATALHQLTDMAAPATPSGTSLSFQPSTAPIGVSGTPYSYLTTATVVVSAGSAASTVYFYADPFGNRSLAVSDTTNSYSLTNFENTTIVTGASGFPAGATRFYHCTFSGTAWNGCSDDRTFISQSNLASSGGGTRTIKNASGFLEVDQHYAVDVITGNYTMVESDLAHLKVLNCSAACTIALPQANTPGSGYFEAGWFAFFTNVGTASASVTTTTSVYAGSGASGSSLTIPTGTSYELVSDGTNYQVVFGGGGGGGGSFTGGSIANGVTISSTSSTAYPGFETDNNAGYGLQMACAGSSAGGTFTNTAATPLANHCYFYDRKNAAEIALFMSTGVEFMPGTPVTIDGNLTVVGTCTGCGTGGGFNNPMTSAGDMIIGGTGGAATRVPAGAATYIWTSNGTGTSPSWQAPPAGGTGSTFSGGTVANATTFNNGLTGTGANYPQMILQGTSAGGYTGFWLQNDTATEKYSFGLGNSTLSGGVVAPSSLFLRDSTNAVNLLAYVPATKITDFQAGAVQIDNGMVLNTTATQPSCVVGIRGMAWFIQSAAGSADHFQVCAKSSSNTYSWVYLF